MDFVEEDDTDDWAGERDGGFDINEQASYGGAESATSYTLYGHVYPTFPLSTLEWSLQICLLSPIATLLLESK